MEILGTILAVGLSYWLGKQRGHRAGYRAGDKVWRDLVVSKIKEDLGILDKLKRENIEAREKLN